MLEDQKVIYILKAEYTDHSANFICRAYDSEERANEDLNLLNDYGDDSLKFEVVKQQVIAA